MPSGSHITGFKVLPHAKKGAMSSWVFNGIGATGFFACGKSHQVFADVRSSKMNFTKCVGFEALAPKYTGPQPAAWEYT